MGRSPSGAWVDDGTAISGPHPDPIPPSQGGRGRVSIAPCRIAGGGGSPGRRMRAWLPAIAALLLALPAHAQAPHSETAIQRDLARTQQDLAREKQRREQVDRTARSYAEGRAKLQQQMIALAAAIQETEKTAARLALDQRRLTAEATAKRVALEARRADLGAMLGGLQRLALHPPDALIALPQPPL